MVDQTWQGNFSCVLNPQGVHKHLLLHQPCQYQLLKLYCHELLRQIDTEVLFKTKQILISRLVLKFETIKHLSKTVEPM